MNSSNTTTTLITSPELMVVYVFPVISQLIIALFIFVFEILKKRNNKKFLEILTQHNNECIEKLSNEVKSRNSQPPFEIVGDFNPPYPSPTGSIKVDQKNKQIRLGDYVISFENTPRNN